MARIFAVQFGIRAVLILIAATFFAWLFDQNIPVAGVKNITYTFSEVGGPVSEPYPRDRIARESAGLQKDRPISMVEDPLYFDVHSRIDYETADIVLYFHNESVRSVQLGMRVFGDTWKTVIPSDQSRGTSGEWDTISAQFDLRDVARFQNKYTFLLSAPGLRYDPNGNESLTISRADIHLTRKPLFPR
ncbi:hypothetical protein HY622_02615 [Candidatus Uhrbacteria bacterium]|nr:hypothetical protein [Candidatus Uhrbacteria bacterium]